MVAKRRWPPVATFLSIVDASPMVPALLTWHRINAGGSSSCGLTSSDWESDAVYGGYLSRLKACNEVAGMRLPTLQAAIFRGELFFPLAALQHAGLPAACGLVPIRSN